MDDKVPQEDSYKKWLGKPHYFDSPGEWEELKDPTQLTKIQ